MDAYYKELIDKYNDNIIEHEGNLYAIRVIGRGNNLFFRENEKCLICDIDAEHGVIYKKSIKIWDSVDEKMTKSEKDRVTALIADFYRKIYNPNVLRK
ncbi:hypothetical protein [Fibrella arboris]|uniref:hypothetical protein n=1 Tax=Fibrella arboris TaxID=3242486 RepID=UPI0035230161